MSRRLSSALVLCLLLPSTLLAMGPVDDSPKPFFTVRTAENDTKPWQDKTQIKKKRVRKKKAYYQYNDQYRFQYQIKNPKAPNFENSTGDARFRRKPATYAMETTASTSREAHRLGFLLGVLEPFGSLFGANIAYNIADFIRATVGFGYLAASGVKLTTIGGDVKLFVPGWRFTPTVGLGLSSISMSAPLTNGSTALGFGDGGTKLFGVFGFDWQARGGFNVDFGVNVGTTNVTAQVPQIQGGLGPSTTTDLLLLPYVGVGWFFNWI